MMGDQYDNISENFMKGWQAGYSTPATVKPVISSMDYPRVSIPSFSDLRAPSIGLQSSYSSRQIPTIDTKQFRIDVPSIGPSSTPAVARSASKVLMLGALLAAAVLAFKLHRKHPAAARAA